MARPTRHRTPATPSATPSTTVGRSRRPLSVFLVDGIDTDNDAIIGDLVPATTAEDAIRKVQRARPYMISLTAEPVQAHLKQAQKLATTPLETVITEWDAFVAEQATLYGDTDA